MDINAWKIYERKFLLRILPTNVEYNKESYCQGTDCEKAHETEQVVMDSEEHQQGKHSLWEIWKLDTWTKTRRENVVLVP